jgi:hypothetical protein
MDRGTQLFLLSAVSVLITLYVYDYLAAKLGVSLLPQV